jgi:hypothetical protein
MTNVLRNYSQSTRVSGGVRVFGGRAHLCGTGEGRSTPVVLNR